MAADLIGAAALKTYVRDLLLAHNVDADQSESVAEILVWCEMVGRTNFGLSRLPIHLQRVEACAHAGECKPVFERLAPSVGRLDGGNGFGHHIGRIAMGHAIDIARESGIGAVGVRDSNFFGAGAYFVNQAAESQMIGLCMSNSFPKVAAHGGAKAVLGTNPFAFGAPRRGGESLMLDMATSSLAGSTVRAAIASGEALPEGLAIDDMGFPITDPNKVEEGALLPFGGPKGYGLSLMVEMLAGVITGAGVSHGVASMYHDFSQGGRNGHFMLALDIGRWMDMETYYDRFEALIASLKSSRPSGSEEDKGVLLPGEQRWTHYREAKTRGISLPADLIGSLSAISRPLGLDAPWPEA